MREPISLTFGWSKFHYAADLCVGWLPWRRQLRNNSAVKVIGFLVCLEVKIIVATWRRPITHCEPVTI